MKINFSIFLITLILIGFVYYHESIQINETNLNIQELSVIDVPPCIRLYELLETYSDKYDVPLNIAIGVAFHETRYKGIFHWDYDPAKISSASAYGAMQVQVQTARGIWKNKEITSTDLLTNMELNVETSMKLLNRLKRMYGTWELALGAYHTGKPIVDNYAKSIVKFKI